MYQEQYWKELYELEVHANYIELYHQKSERWDNAINTFSAITSSSSIAGWVIWQQYSFVWGGIIALSQVISAIKMFLPYKARVNSLPRLLHELEEIFIDAERDWYKVSEGHLTEEQIHKLLFQVREK